MKFQIMRAMLFASAFLLAGQSTAGSTQASELDATFDYRVLGWSDDSARWGFQEKGDYGCGMLYDPGSGVYVIDAAKNRFVFEHFDTVGELDDQDERRANRIIDRSAREDLARARSLGLNGNQGTVVYRAPKMVWVTYDTNFRQHGTRELDFEYQGRSYEIRLEDSILDDPDQTTMAGKKSKFSLSVRRVGGTWHLLQADRSHWRPYLAYRIVYASISPDSKKVAVLIEAVENALEGQKQAYYKGVTGLLP